MGILNSVFETAIMHAIIPMEAHMQTRLHQRVLFWLRNRFDSELFTYEQLRAMFIPLLLDQLFIFGIGLLSNAMVSSSGAGAISAVNDATVIGALAYALYSAISVGAGIVIARAKGAKDQVHMRHAIGQSCVICTLGGSVFGIAISAFGTGIVKALYPSVDPAVALAAGEYLRIFGLSIIPYALFNAIFTVFRSIGDTKSSLALTLIINTIHLVCSLLYINVFEMGVSGSALSYLTARVIGVIFALYWLMRPSCALHMRWKDFTHYDRSTSKDIFMLGIPLSIEQVLFQGGMLLVQMYIAKLPLYQTDAHGIANSVFMLYYVFAYSMTNITSTVCGQCVGAKDIGLAKRYCRNFIWIGGYIMAAAILIIGPLTPLVLKLYAPSQASIKYIYLAVFIGALPMPFIWCRAFLTTTTARAAGDSAFATGISLIALLIGRMMTGYLLSITLGFGILGIWLGQLVEWIFRTIVFRYRMKGTKWIKVQV